ncbi:MAG: hypothetical protein ACTHQM_15585 [Thermoanaerobaculia bacterium]
MATATALFLEASAIIDTEYGRMIDALAELPSTAEMRAIWHELHELRTRSRAVADSVYLVALEEPRN